MNAASFRALRETCGLSQRAVAEHFEVTTQAVKQWEKGVHPVPGDAQEWMDEQAMAHDRAVADTVIALERMVEDTNASLGLPGDNRPPMELNYWRRQEDYDANGRDSGDVGVVNARTRAVAAALRGLGYGVRFHYV